MSAPAARPIPAVETSWRLLFDIALSHGESLRLQRITYSGLLRFVESAGLMGPETGIYLSVVDDLWRKHCAPCSTQQLEDPGSPFNHSFSSGGAVSLPSETPLVQPGTPIPCPRRESYQARRSAAYDKGAVGFEGFTDIMNVLSVRCFQSHQCRVLHDEEWLKLRRAIKLSAEDRTHLEESVAYTAKIYLKQYIAQNIVHPQSRIALDPCKNDWTNHTNMVVTQVVGGLEESVIVPLFKTYASDGLLSRDGFLRFVDDVFPHFSTMQRATSAVIFERGGFADIRELLSCTSEANSSETAFAIGLDGFVDAMLLLSVVVYADEHSFPHHRSITSKIWSVFEDYYCRAAANVSMTEDPCFIDPDDRAYVKPVVSYLHPARLPIDHLSSFLVGGLNVLVKIDPGTLGEAVEEEEESEEEVDGDSVDPPRAAQSATTDAGNAEGIDGEAPLKVENGDSPAPPDNTPISKLIGNGKVGVSNMRNVKVVRPRRWLQPAKLRKAKEAAEEKPRRSSLSASSSETSSEVSKAPKEVAPAEMTTVTVTMTATEGTTALELLSPEAGGSQVVETPQPEVRPPRPSALRVARQAATLFTADFERKERAASESLIYGERTCRVYVNDLQARCIPHAPNYVEVELPTALRDLSQFRCVVTFAVPDMESPIPRDRAYRFVFTPIRRVMASLRHAERTEEVYCRQPLILAATEVFEVVPLAVVNGLRGLFSSLAEVNSPASPMSPLPVGFSSTTSCTSPCPPPEPTITSAQFAEICLQLRLVRDASACATAVASFIETRRESGEEVEVQQGGSGSLMLSFTTFACCVALVCAPHGASQEVPDLVQHLRVSLAMFAREHLAAAEAAEAVAAGSGAEAATAAPVPAPSNTAAEHRPAHTPHPPASPAPSNALLSSSLQYIPMTIPHNPLIEVPYKQAILKRVGSKEEATAKFAIVLEELQKHGMATMTTAMLASNSPETSTTSSAATSATATVVDRRPLPSFPVKLRAPHFVSHYSFDEKQALHTDLMKTSHRAREGFIHSEVIIKVHVEPNEMT